MRGAQARAPRAVPYHPGMSPMLRSLCIPFLGLCTLAVAQEGEKGKPQDPPKTEKQAPKDAAAGDAVIQAIDAYIAEKKIDKQGNWKTKLPEPPKLTFDGSADYFWHVETEVGTVKIRYFADTAPIHVASGLYLARLGFYDGLGFHRIIPGFMAQGGCPQGDGRGGPGYQFKGEYQGTRKHTGPGMLSMANAGPGTDGSQFFLTFVPTPHLDGRHTLWGEVVDGKDTLKALEAKGTSANNGMLAKPIKIVKTWISVEKKAKAEAPAADKKEEKK
jgi:peptidyl-prolyl cis-trans isomerase B (cyclophilin B)